MARTGDGEPRLEHPYETSRMLEKIESHLQRLELHLSQRIQGLEDRVNFFLGELIQPTDNWRTGLKCIWGLRGRVTRSPDAVEIDRRYIRDLLPEFRRSTEVIGTGWYRCPSAMRTRARTAGGRDRALHDFPQQAIGQAVAPPLTPVFASTARVTAIPLLITQRRNSASA